MKNLELLIEHTILSVHERSDFIISSPSKQLIGIFSEVDFYMWSTSNNQISSINTKKIKIVSLEHAIDIADLLMQEMSSDAYNKNVIENLMEEATNTHKKFLPMKSLTPMITQLDLDKFKK